jgi:hypothetical protein
MVSGSSKLVPRCVFTGIRPVEASVQNGKSSAAIQADSQAPNRTNPVQLS